MIWLLLIAHGIGVAVLAAAGDRLGRFSLVLGAFAPALTTIWALPRLETTAPATAELSWVTQIDLEIAFSVGPFAALLTVIISGIGVGVFVYSTGYFKPGTSGTGRFAATLLAFSASMVGIVWADSIWTLFVFWELTSITSFLLIGHKQTDPVALLAARRALLITSGGGLALLAGCVIAADVAGTARLSEMGALSGTRATVAAALVLAAAATKSAQFPFHVWLPGAMAAPTPVSAYLHSATMVKAGVVLVAIASPVLGSVAIWQPVGTTLGLITMIWGGIGALRQRDAKLILAWSTVSQLGLMVALLSVGTAKGTFAAMAILVAHALFKAALFMVIGEIDVRTGTRDINQLSGLWRTMPTPFVIAVLAGASMAAIPPLVGFPAKEAAIEAVLQLSGFSGAVVAAGVIGGSVLTVAYTVRLLRGVFADAPGAASTRVGPQRRALTAVAGVLGAAGLVAFLLLGTVSDWVRASAIDINPEASSYGLHRWPGLTVGLAVSFGVLVVGLTLASVLPSRSIRPLHPFGAELVDSIIHRLLRATQWLTARVQHGSLPAYLAAMAATSGLAMVPFVFALNLDGLYRWDSTTQAFLAVLVAVAALTAALVHSRLGAAMGLGAVGIGVAGLFVAHGAPDLALTQLVIEIVIVAGFVMGLGHLTRRFPRSGLGWRTTRLSVAVLVGATVTIALLATGGNRQATPPIEALSQQGVTEGGGNNLVNVILTDIRGLDTLGEIVVLLVVSIGVLALTRRREVDDDVEPEPVANSGHLR